MALILNDHQLETIVSHAERTYPDECCGLLVGKLTALERVISNVWSTENRWTADMAEGLLERAPASRLPATKAHHYWIAPEEMLAAMKDARQRNLEIVGIYHSHPDHPAVPSECDRRLAWSQYSYLIVSVLQGKATNAQSWVLDENHQFQPEAIHSIEGSRMRRESLILNL